MPIHSTAGRPFTGALLRLPPPSATRSVPRALSTFLAFLIRQARNLRLSMRLLERFSNGARRYPILIAHDEPLDAKEKGTARDSSLSSSPSHLPPPPSSLLLPEPPS